MIGRMQHRPEDKPSSDPVLIKRLRREAFLLECVTVVWNVFEGIAAILVGLAAGSVALVGFGLDSMVEVFASLVVVAELRGDDRKREGVAVRLIGGGYLIVAAYILWGWFRSLALADHPSGSPLGIALTTATVVAMISLAICNTERSPTSRRSRGSEMSHVAEGECPRIQVKIREIVKII